MTMMMTMTMVMMVMMVSVGKGEGDEEGKIVKGRQRCSGNLLIGSAFYSTWKEVGLAISLMSCSVTAQRLHETFTDVEFLVLINGSLVRDLRGRQELVESQNTLRYKALPVDVPSDVYISNFRWTQIHTLLLQSKKRYCHVLALDLSDTFLQSNPFERIYPYLRTMTPINGIKHRRHYLLLAHEGMAHIGDSLAITIGDSGVNRYWMMNECWGEWKQSERAKACSESISCSGTVMGTHLAMLEYTRLLERVWAENPRCYHKIPELDHNQDGIDQGAHNVIVHLFLKNFTVPVYFPPNAVNILFSMGIPAIEHYHPAKFHQHTTGGDGNRLYNFVDDFVVTIPSTNSTPSVLHQYDRDKVYARRLLTFFPLETKCNVTFRKRRWTLLGNKYLQL